MKGHVDKGRSRFARSIEEIRKGGCSDESVRPFHFIRLENGTHSISRYQARPTVQFISCGSEIKTAHLVSDKGCSGLQADRLGRCIFPFDPEPVSNYPGRSSPVTVSVLLNVVRADGDERPEFGSYMNEATHHYWVISPEIGEVDPVFDGTGPIEYGSCVATIEAPDKQTAKILSLKVKEMRPWVREARSDLCSPLAGLRVEDCRCPHGFCYCGYCLAICPECEELGVDDFAMG